MLILYTYESWIVCQKSISQHLHLLELLHHFNSLLIEIFRNHLLPYVNIWSQSVSCIRDQHDHLLAHLPTSACLLLFKKEHRGVCCSNNRYKLPMLFFFFFLHLFQCSHSRTQNLASTVKYGTEPFSFFSKSKQAVCLVENSI